MASEVIVLTNFIINMCTVGQKKKKLLYLFQYKLSYRNETGANHRGLQSTLV